MKRLLWIAIAVVIVAALVLLTGGWYFSDQILNGSLKVDQRRRAADLEVAEISADRITLRTMPRIKTTDWRAEGLWGLQGDSGHDRVGEILDLRADEVTRRCSPASSGIEVGDTVRMDHFVFVADPFEDHGIAFEAVRYSSELGSFPAWYIEGSTDVWAIFVHGRIANRDGRIEALRILPAVADLGLHSLVINYRNDPGVPANPDGFHRFGLTEWQDVEGAVRYALDHGAQGIVLVGFSMGGGAVTEFLYESPLAAEVEGVILDAPMLDFGATIDHGASQRKLPVIGVRVPGFLTWTAKLVSSVRFGIDYGELNYLSRADELAAPILLFHGDVDREAPVRTSDKLAEARPDIVRYIRVPGADHTRSWNVARSEYESAVKEFLNEVAR